MIAFSCECGKRYQVKDELAGKRATCAVCGKQLLIPSQPTPAPKVVRTSAHRPMSTLPSSLNNRGSSTGVSSNHMALFAGSVGALLAIAGLGVWLFSGSPQAISASVQPVQPGTIPEPSPARLARILKDIEGHREEKERSSPAGGGLLLIPLPVAIEVLKQTGHQTVTFSTQLSEAKLISEYGQPDEVGQDFMYLQKGQFQSEKKRSKFVRYDWLKFMITPEGEICGIKNMNGAHIIGKEN